MGTEKTSRFRNFALLGFSRINENNPEIIGASQARSVLVINDITVYGTLAYKLSSSAHTVLTAIQKLQRRKIHIQTSKF